MRRKRLASKYFKEIAGIDQRENERMKHLGENVSRRGYDTLATFIGAAQEQEAYTAIRREALERYKARLREMLS